jgi:fatty-acyl-CoA synthase
MSLQLAVERRRAGIERRHPSWVQMSLDDYFARAAADFGGRDLVVTDQRSWSYAEVLAWSERLAAGLRAQGLQAGDRVGIIMANDPVVVPLLFAIWRLGMVAVPINTLYRAEELAYVIGQSRCRFLVIMAQFRGRDFVADLDRIEPGWRAGRYERFADLKGIAVHGDAPDAPVGFDALMQEALPDAAAPAARAGANDAAIIMYTSGTTGNPKGVLLTHDNLLRCAYTVAYHHAFEDGRRALFALPMYHCYGVIQGLLAGLVVGGAMIAQLKFDPVAMLTAIGRHRASYLMVVPTMMLALLEEAKQAPHRYDFSSLTAIHNAAAPTPVPVWLDISKTFGCEAVFTSYGQTETTALIIGTLPGDPIERVAQTQGVPALAGVAGIAALGQRIAEFKLIDPETGADCAPGSAGEICTRGPLNSKGYFERPEETAKLFLAGGWLRTGDLGAFRDDGYLVLTGRCKDLYKCGGELVSPKEVEDLLCRHAGVSQAYVHGLPDPRWGEIGCAWVVRADAAAVGEAELADYLSRHLARFKVPARIFFVSADRLPKTGTGKVQKAVLRDRAIALAGNADGQAAATS